ncbi:MAG: SufE family protein [Rhodothermales bacterium]|nr:SufE family protein [Rhodothermales bacterium]
MGDASRLQALTALFAGLDAAERLEVLTDYAGRLPPLDPTWAAARDAGLHLVLECQAPVFFVAFCAEGCVRIHADVPAEAPVARGFVSMLIETFDGADCQEVRDAPEDLLGVLGLAVALGMRRRQGLGAIYRRLKEAG